MPKDVEAHLPNGKIVTVQGVPDDLSPDDFKSQFRQRHPEYFGDTPSGETLPTRTLDSGYSSPGLATLFGQKDGQPKAPPIEEKEPGFWRSFVEQTKSLADMPFAALGAPVVSPPQAASIGNTVMNALSQSNKPINPKTGLPVVDPTGTLKGLHTAAALTAPFGGGSLETGLEQFESRQFRSAAGTAAGAALPFAVVKGPEAAKVAQDTFQGELAATSHDILNKSSNQIKGKIWDAHNQVGQRVGKLVNDISAADYQKSGPSIPVADLWSQVQDIADRYKATGKDTPKFAAAADAISQRGPYLTWKELHDLKQEIDPLWKKSAEGSRDSGATNELREAINNKLSTRAKEIDRTQQFDAYNKLWKTLMQYEGEGTIGKLLNAPDGKTFMDILKDPANKNDLTRSVNDLSQFGLDKNTFKNFQDTHEPLHRFVSDAQKKAWGRISVIARRPAAGGIGAAIGTGLGSVAGHPLAGGIVGGLTGVSLADRIAAARAIQKLGRPSLAGEMGEATKVMPVGTGERPTAPPPAPGAVNRDELIQAMKGLGYSKAEAADRAMQGMTEHPNDFTKALNRAMQGPAKPPAEQAKPTAPTSKAEAIKQVKTVSGGSTPQPPAPISVPPTETRSIVRPGPKTIPTNVPPKTAEMIQEIKKMEQAKIGAPKSAKPREAFDQAKAEWQSENPGKDAKKHLDEIKRRAANLSKGK